MLEMLLFALWFFVPAGVANMAPVIAAHLPGYKELNAPLDFGVMWRGQRLLGPHKTWRGLIAGIVAATAIVLLQQYLVHQFGWFAQAAVDTAYMLMPPLLLGPLLALGALGGDAVESFAKRRRNIPSGGVWLPYDIIDHIIGAMVLASLLVIFAWWIYPAVVVLWATINFGISYAASHLGLKARPI